MLELLKVFRVSLSGYTLLLDGDILCYRAGFGAEKRIYFDERNPPSDGGLSFPSKKEAKLNVPEQYLKWERNTEPLDHALYNCKSLIQTALQNVTTHFQTDDLEYITYLSGNDQTPNFRKELTPDYKANRDEAHRPTHLEELKNYLIERHAAQVSQGCEADDFFGQGCLDAVQNGRVPIIGSIDKDLKQIPGFHLNLVSGEIQEVTQEQADIKFWRQMLEGDRADNIEGIPGIGPKKAERYLPQGITNATAKEKVQSYYEANYQAAWEEKYNLNCDLLWIWRKVPDHCPFKTSTTQVDSPLPDQI